MTTDGGRWTTEREHGRLSSIVYRLKARARELGFAFCGLTTPERPPHVAQYEQWIADGMHGHMHYLAADRARQRRADPRLIFPECKTIIAAARPYPAGNTTGPIAAYALGADYHDGIPRRLRELIAWLESETGRPIAHKIYSDTGPLLERDLAQRAGLGWIGKNTLLINPRAGSYFLLGEALIDLELPPDPPFAADHCGACTRCIDACPTGAILDGRALDARRCISYLTIELKGPIPEELREKTGSWIFGCDICQAVCPWNIRFADITRSDDRSDDFSRSPNTATEVATTAATVAATELAAELSLTTEQFNAKFKGSPVKRAKRRGYLRNVAVALGNTGGENARQALEKCLISETDPLVREHAVTALSSLSAWALAKG